MEQKGVKAQDSIKQTPILQIIKFLYLINADFVQQDLLNKTLMKYLKILCPLANKCFLLGLII